MSLHTLLFNKWSEYQPMANPNTIHNYTRMMLKYQQWEQKYTPPSGLNPVISWTCEQFNIYFNQNTIKAFLDTHENLNTKSSYCAVICSYLNYFNGETKILEKSREFLLDIKIEIGLETDKHKKTVVQDKNWRSLKDIRKCLTKRGKWIDEFKYFDDETRSKTLLIDLQRYVISMLYMGFNEHPPVRCNYTMEVVNDVAPFPALLYKQKINYLIDTGNSMLFVFNSFKTVKTMGQQIIPVCDGLETILEKWIHYLIQNKIHTDLTKNYLLYNSRFNKLSDNMLASYIPTAFQECKAKLTVDTLRHVFISDECNLGNSKKYAKLMMHSQMEQANYWKE